MNKRIITSVIGLTMLAGVAQAVGSLNDANEERINALIKQMTVEEKVRFCYGCSMGFPGLERLSIPEVGCCDGPRGPNAKVGTTAFPVGIAFGATWNPALVERAGAVQGEETRACGRGVLLGPGCNILRDPLGGRFFEYYTEDPLLNSRIAEAQVRGIQSQGVAACIKHYACNNREENRNNYFSVVDERTLHEIYLPAFKAAVDAGVMTVMTSANGVNYNYVSDDRYLLSDVLKQQWGFRGFVMTDWLGTRSTHKAAWAGLDISMPGGEHCGFAQALLRAVKDGSVAEAEVDEKVRRILRVYDALGLLKGESKSLPEGKIATEEHCKVAQTVAEEGIVLLKNENNSLPLNPKKIKNVLVTGPNADKKHCLLVMGGSSWVQGPYEITVLEGLRKALGNDKVTYISSDELGGFSLIANDLLKADDKTQGVNARYYRHGSNDPVVTKVVENVDYMWEMKSPVPEIKVEDFREARFDTWIHAKEDGKYTLKFITGGGSLLAYNNEWAGAPIAISPSNRGDVVTANVEIRKGSPFHLCVIYTRGEGDAAIRIEIESPDSDASAKQMARIRKAAKKADAVIVVGGIDHSIDTEGRDRQSLELPKAQATLVENLSQCNKNVSLVLLNGSPLEIGNVEPHANSIVEAWYPGMEAGRAVANVLTGVVNPSGRLPFTWAKTLNDYPSTKAHQDLDHVLYTDSLNVGYRYFDRNPEAVMYPFGHGLSYTTFAYSDMKVSRTADNKVECSLTLTNTGKRDGAEVVQIYVNPVNPAVARPQHELKAFEKVWLKSGESRRVTLTLDRDAFSFYDITCGGWRFDPCRYIIEAGSNTAAIHLRSEIDMK